MSISQKAAAYCLVALLAGVGLTNCGGTGPSNDQGTSFLALGFFIYNDSNELVPIGAVDSTLNAESPALSVAGVLVDGKRERVLIGTENRLSTQFIRQTRTDCRYEVPGSNLSIPNISTVQGQVLSPAVFDDSAKVPRIAQPNEDTTVADGGRAQFWFSLVNILPTDLFSFLNNSGNSLPQLPFLMNVTCTSVGVTQAGRVLETNSVSIPVTFFDEAEVAEVVGSASVTQGDSASATDSPSAVDSADPASYVDAIDSTL